VISVTVPNENISKVYVHPYPIHSPDSTFVADVIENALYFPIKMEDFEEGQKRYEIIHLNTLVHLI
jgi:hypothetical protein